MAARTPARRAATLAKARPLADVFVRNEAARAGVPTAVEWAGTDVVTSDPAAILE